VSRREWIDAESFAAVAGISRQAAWKALRRDVWRGVHLEVRIVHGRGGRSGATYEVLVRSLPPDLQEQLKASQTPLRLSLPLPSASPGGIEGGWWHFHLQHLLAFPKGSKERGEAVKAMVGKTVLDWKNRPLTFARSTILNKLRVLEDTNGAGALRRKPRADTGKPKVVISRDWDRAASHAGIDAETQAHVAHDMLQRLRGCIQQGGTVSRTMTDVNAFLAKLSMAHGLRLSPREMGQVCRVPVRFYWREAPEHSRVYRHKHDRKASADAMPHVRRVMPDGPGQLYVLDVHHINVLVKEGNKIGTVKMLGCLDMGTRRFTADFVFFELRGGVRNSDNIELPRRVFSELSWGVPGAIYVDNGKEYRFARHLEDALRLAAEAAGSMDERESRVINSLPYNAQSKPIENVHHQLNNHEFRLLPGFIDDDRFNPMRPELGKLPKPFGGFDAFVELARGLIDAYNWTPQPHGQLKGDSPNSRFRHHVERGWRPIIMKPEDFDGIFCEPATRTVRNHAVKVAGRYWTCPELDEFAGTSVVARVPIYHGFNELRLERPDGKFLGIARPEREFEFTDPRGAHHSADRKARARKAIARLAGSVPTVDLLASRLEFGRSQQAIAPPEAAGVVSVNLDGPAARTVVPSPVRPTTRAEREAERAELLAIRQKYAKGSKG